MMATWPAQSCILPCPAFQLLLLTQLSHCWAAQCHNLLPVFGDLPTLGILPEAPCPGCTNQRPGPALEQRAKRLRSEATRWSLRLWQRPRPGYHVGREVHVI